MRGESQRDWSEIREDKIQQKPCKKQFDKIGFERTYYRETFLVEKDQEKMAIWDKKKIAHMKNNKRKLKKIYNIFETTSPFINETHQISLEDPFAVQDNV